MTLDSAPRRVLLKISGEALASREKCGVDAEAVSRLVDEVASVAHEYQIAIVVGGGNFFRGSIQGKMLAMEEVDAHYTGMIATIMNGTILKSMLKKRGIDARHASELDIPKVAEPYLYERARRHLEKGRTMVLSGGVGRSHFTTDTGMVQYALEIGATSILKGTKVDGIYESDPALNPGAVLIPWIRAEDFIQKNLKILDATAVALARDNGVAITVFNIFKKGSLAKLLSGEANTGSFITP